MRGRKLAQDPPCGTPYNCNTVKPIMITYIFYLAGELIFDYIYIFVGAGELILNYISTITYHSPLGPFRAL